MSIFNPGQEVDYIIGNIEKPSRKYQAVYLGMTPSGRHKIITIDRHGRVATRYLKNTKNLCHRQLDMFVDEKNDSLL